MTVFGFPALILALGLLWAQRHLGGVLTGEARARWITRRCSGSTGTRSCT